MARTRDVKYMIGQSIKTLIGLVIIIYGISNIYLSLSAEAIGSNLFTLGIIIFGGYLVVSSIKKPGVKTRKVFKYLGIAFIIIIAISMIFFII